MRNYILGLINRSKLMSTTCLSRWLKTPSSEKDDCNHLCTWVIEDTLHQLIWSIPPNISYNKWNKLFPLTSLGILKIKYEWISSENIYHQWSKKEFVEATELWRFHYPTQDGCISLWICRCQNHPNCCKAFMG